MAETESEYQETPDNVLIPEVVEDDREIGTGETLPEETGDLIEDAVRFINMTTKKMLAEYAIRIGNYLLARLFQAIAADITPLTYTHQRYLAQLPHSEAKQDLTVECIEQKMPSRILYQRIQEVKQVTLLPGPDVAQLQKKIITQYSTTISRFVQKAALPEMLTGPENLNNMEPDVRTRFRETAAQWAADFKAKRIEYQSLIRMIEEIEFNRDC